MFIILISYNTYIYYISYFVHLNTEFVEERIIEDIYVQSSYKTFSNIALYFNINVTEREEKCIYDIIYMCVFSSGIHQLFFQFYCFYNLRLLRKPFIFVFFLLLLLLCICKEVYVLHILLFAVYL